MQGTVEIRWRLKFRRRQSAPPDLVFAENAAGHRRPSRAQPGAVVLRRFAGDLPARTLRGRIRSSPPLVRSRRQAAQPTFPPSASTRAVFGDHVELGGRRFFGASAVIGDDVQHRRRHPHRSRRSDRRRRAHRRILPHLSARVLYPGTTLGNRVVVHAGAVLGADGFGYVRDPATGAYTQFPQQGTLVIEDDVEIGANCTVDRGALAETRIRRGTKFDNLVHVGHNCDIGEDVILVILTGISGSIHRQRRSPRRPGRHRRPRPRRSRRDPRRPGRCLQRQNRH